MSRASMDGGSGEKEHHEEHEEHQEHQEHEQTSRPRSRTGVDPPASRPPSPCPSLDIPIRIPILKWTRRSRREEDEDDGGGGGGSGRGWDGPMRALRSHEDRMALFSTLNSFRQYRQLAHFNVTHARLQSFHALPAEHWEMLAAPPFSYLDTFHAVDDAIEANGALTAALLRRGLATFDLPADPAAAGARRGHRPPGDWRRPCGPKAMGKAHGLFRQLFREWSAEGAAEREAAYDPVLAALAEAFPVPGRGRGRRPGSGPGSRRPRHEIQVLVPGAGLGRLVFEICLAGFDVEGNECSFHDLLTSSYILNEVAPRQQHTIYPWAFTFANWWRRPDQLQCVRVPDVHPGTALRQADLDAAAAVEADVAANEALDPAAAPAAAARVAAAANGSADATADAADDDDGNDVGVPTAVVPAAKRLRMTATDFLLAYGDGHAAGRRDAVCTVFFIDTAPNFLRYIETVRHCLKPGGLWINVGPLFWHYRADDPGANLPERDGDHDRAGYGAGSGSGMEPDDGRPRGIAEPGMVELTNEEVLWLLERHGFAIEKRAVGDSLTTYTGSPLTMYQCRYQLSIWIARKL
ncbi:MAG: hypothetical protein M1826_005886 [Phylliscum demangeonii]|nr:MAG: hypothetical protein M1826_005886 [Phylliscum demangeonii]